MQLNNPQIDQSPTTSPLAKIMWVAVTVIAIVLVGAAGWYLAGNKIPVKTSGANTNYQAVFLTNGQVYFGKLVDSGSWIKLTDIYYLQVTQNLQQTATSDQTHNANPTPASTTPPQSNIQLVKLGNELHGPQDEMNIARDKILFWENMKDDSKVVQAIHQYKIK
ncbi:MAG TPA: hypothetical protein VF974_05545 [Patescibacteria group bacterium]